MNKIKARRSPGTKILGVPGIKEIHTYIHIYVYIYIYIHIYIYTYTHTYTHIKNRTDFV